MPKGKKGRNKKQGKAQKGGFKPIFGTLCTGC